MNKKELSAVIQKLVKDIRIEESFSQEVMADTIGISKKTYIQIEKNRILLKWAETVTICTIFENNKYIRNHFGEDIFEIIQVIAFQKIQNRQFATLGGNVWWNDLEVEEGIVLQQHKISKHYRILDKDKFRLYFTILKEDVYERFNGYIRK